MRAQPLAAEVYCSMSSSLQPASRKLTIVFSSIVRLGVLLVLEEMAIAYVDALMMYIAYID